MHDLTNPRTLVLDLGTATTKSGWTDFGEPDLVNNSIKITVVIYKFNRKLSISIEIPGTYSLSKTNPSLSCTNTHNFKDMSSAFLLPNRSN